jgi:hypothetical protein
MSGGDTLQKRRLKIPDSIIGRDLWSLLKDITQRVDTTPADIYNTN